ncbi:MAG: GAF domain-containing protein [Lysobacter sp.]|nr:GAF domain-containing protein [Lysobacter sp.]
MSASPARHADDPASRILATLEKDGVHAALRLLNERAPHRFTGIYRYDGDMLRNVILFDVHDPHLRRGGDIPMQHSYCALLQDSDARTLEFDDPRSHPPSVARSHLTPVVSYCGVVLVDAAGQPFGSLCHYDLNPCQPRTSDLAMLRSLAPQFASAAIAMEMAEIGGSPV